MIYLACRMDSVCKEIRPFGAFVKVSDAGRFCQRRFRVGAE